MLHLKRLQTGYAHCLYEPPLDAVWKPGSLVALLGRNGTGKTTLLRCLGGMAKPAAGAVHWENKPLWGMAPRLLARIAAWLPANARPDVPYMLLSDLVSMGRYPHSSWTGRFSQEDRQAVRQALEAMGIERELAQRPLNLCSEGEIQLAQLARALAQQAPLLLLDEPLAHLDFVNRRLVFEHLRRLAHDRNRLVVLVTHEPELAAEFADLALALAPPQRLLDTAPACKDWLLALYHKT